MLDNTVIRPFQELLIDCFDKILAYNNIALKLYFTTLQPLEFTEIDTDIQDEETIEEETGVEMSQDIPELSDEDGKNILDRLEGETMSDEWEIVDEREYEEDNQDIDNWANMLIDEKNLRYQK